MSDCRKLYTTSFVITSEMGLHLRPASLFVKMARRFQSRITVRKGEKEVDGKNVLGLVTLEAFPGDQLEVRINGEDAGAALAAVEALLAEEFCRDQTDA